MYSLDFKGIIGLFAFGLVGESRRPKDIFVMAVALLILSYFTQYATHHLQSVPVGELRRRFLIHYLNFTTTIARILGAVFGIRVVLKLVVLSISDIHLFILYLVLSATYSLVNVHVLENTSDEKPLGPRK